MSAWEPPQRSTPRLRSFGTPPSASGGLAGRELNESEVARRFDISHASVNRWVRVLAQPGSKGLQRTGRKPGLSTKDLKRLEQGLLKGPEALGYETSLWTLARVSRLIEQEFGVRYHKGHAWRILCRLKWSCRWPVGRARAGRKGH
jgi:transposase